MNYRSQTSIRTFVEISTDWSWDAHTAKIIGKGRSHVGKMDATLTDSHLDTREQIRIMMNRDCTIARVCKSMGREREVGKKQQLKSTRMPKYDE